MKTQSITKAFTLSAIVTLVSIAAFANDLECNVVTRPADGGASVSAQFAQTIVNGSAKLDLGTTDTGYSLVAIYLNSQELPNLITIGAKKDLVFGCESSGSANFKIGGRHVSNTYEIECAVK